MEVVKEARVFDRGRNGDGDEGEAGAVDEDAKAGCEGERVEPSDPAEWDREVIGTVRFLTCLLRGSEASPGGGDSSSSGTSSAFGIGRPLPAATS